MASASNAAVTTVVLPLDGRSAVISFEAKSALSRTERRVLARVLVNPGQGCQRTLLCSGVKTVQISHVLATRADCASLSGLAGVHFAMADVGAGVLHVRGPRGLTTLCQGWEAFVKRRYPEMDVREINPSDGALARLEYKEEGLALGAIALQPVMRRISGGSPCIWCFASKRSAPPASDNETSDESSTETSESESDVESDDGTASSDSDPSDKDSTTLNQTASSLFGMGIRPTLCFWLRFNGAPLMLIVDCTSEEELDLLENNPHLAFACDEHRPKIIVHLAPESILKSPKYIRWMGTGSKGTTQHIYLHEFARGPARYTRSNEYLRSLQEEDPCHFKLDYSALAPSSTLSATSLVVHGADGPLEREEVRFNATTNDDDEAIMEDVASFSSGKDVLMVDPSEINIDMDEEHGEIAQSKKSKQIKYSADIAYPSLLFLGTGGAKPSVLRGLSSILVRIKSNCSLLLDAGEDLLYQIERRWTTSCELGREIDAIKAVWISHHHLDHHGGLISLIEEKLNRAAKEGEQILHVFAPESVLQFLKHVLHADALNRLGLHHCREAPTVMADVILATRQVEHCYDAHACLVSLGSIGTLLYTGDTRPCTSRLKAMISQAGADPAKLVLVHEATFGEDRKEEAIRKRHSTLTEAVQVAEALRVALLLATHASQRYPTGIPSVPSRVPLVQVHDLMEFDLGSALSGPQ